MYVCDAAGLNLSLTSTAPSSRSIHLSLGTVEGSNGSDEAYKLTIDAQSNITIVGPSAAGVFYGVQTLISLAYTDGKVPTGTITDWPRYQHRGQMVDVARNFHSGVSDIKKIIDAMAMYKMNRLHFHLGDDEGWRLEIPGLPELTQVH
jgi:hexosaminidase